MKRVMFIAMCAAALLAGSAEAKSKGKNDRGVVVPFEFSVQNMNMPAGHYEIIPQGQAFALVRNIETGRSVHVMRDLSPDGSRTLIFRNGETGKKLVRIG